MAQRPSVAFGNDFVVRGLALAQRRMAYLTELHESGRWRRYFSEPEVLVVVREAKAAVDAWGRLEQLDPIESLQTDLSPAVANISLLGPQPISENEIESTMRLPSDFGGYERPKESRSLAAQDSNVHSQPRPPLPPIVFSANHLSAERG
jgi:uncharacterized repeat protein (TIGR03809 family)